MHIRFSITTFNGICFISIAVVINGHMILWCYIIASRWWGTTIYLVLQKRVRYGDPDFEETILKWAEEEYSSDFNEEDDDVSDSEAIISEHDSESEIEVEEHEDDLSELDFVYPWGKENSNQNDTISRYYYGNPPIQ